MYLIKSKRTGREERLSDEEYAKMVNDAPEGFMKRFIVTEVNVRSIISKPPIKLNKTKYEG